MALVPEVVRKLTGAGHEVLVERGAGEGALIPDSEYEDAGATLVGPGEPFDAQVVVKVARAERARRSPA